MIKLKILLLAVTVMALAVPANALIGEWEAAASSASPGFLATNVAAGVYDIGALSGDITYEFVVNSNPDETEVSMALIGRHGHGDTTAAIKYEQWNNTGTYGATVFGVADHDFGVATNPGVDTLLTFVSSAGETALYVDGVYQASVAAEITLSGVVGIGYANKDPNGIEFIDPFDGEIFGVAIYDSALSADQIAANSDAYFYVPVISSVVRSNGVNGDRDPIGAYDGTTAVLAMEAGGLQNGSAVFSDRTYPWTGIPAEFEGTEYIRTFNSDKGSGDVTYEVTTSKYAIVWVTVDDRTDSLQGRIDSVTAAIAQAGTFADTGIDIYIAEKDDGSRDRPLSVFAADLPAGTYVFGGSSGNNFYIIGAIAAEAPVFMPTDVTAPGDAVLGVPNDGLMDGQEWGWPGGELPNLAVDNDVNTKFLHFKGENESTGIQVTPAAGATLVTGLTLTTANDSAPRDPITYEVFGIRLHMKFLDLIRALTDRMSGLPLVLSSISPEPMNGHVSQ